MEYFRQKAIEVCEQRQQTPDELIQAIRESQYTFPLMRLYGECQYGANIRNLLAWKASHRKAKHRKAA